MLRSTFVARLFLLSILVAFASAARAAEVPPALVSAARDLLEWTPVVDYESITLSLADPQGRVRVHRFGPGVAPVLSLFDTRGMPLPDGIYTWELRVTPRPGAGRPAAPLIQSGYFTISSGDFVAPDLSEPPEKIIASEDQMVPDDLIVDGKSCIGLGCANNETFFAEALRLKQSVVRLRFEDTSTAAGRPSRDWQLAVNDAASGGADRFSIEDLTAGTTPITVRGGAPSNSLYVDGVGHLGLGTATPATRLHFLSTDPSTTSFAATKFLVENASTTVKPRELFEVRNNGDAAYIFKNTVEPERWYFGTFAHNFIIDNQATSGVDYYFGPTGNLTIAGTLTQNSDRTTKTDVQPVDPRAVLSRMAELPINTWRKMGDPSTHLGPMAQDFRAAFGLGDDERHIAPGDLAGVSLAALQGLHALVEEQRQLLEKQQELIGQLEERLRRLEAQERPE